MATQRQSIAPEAVDLLRSLDQDVARLLQIVATEPTGFHVTLTQIRADKQRAKADALAVRLKAFIQGAAA